MAVTFRNRFGSWKLLSNAVRKHLDQMPSLTASLEVLERHIEKAEALAHRQAALRGELQLTVRERTEAETLGEELRQRLAAAVQSQLGFKTEMLHEFGIAPRKRRRKSEKNPDNPAPAAPAPASPAKP
jgi:hypothetical protein